MSNLIIQDMEAAIEEVRSIIRQCKPLSDEQRFCLRLTFAKRWLEVHEAVPHSSFQYASLYITFCAQSCATEPPLPSATTPRAKDSRLSASL